MKRRGILPILISLFVCGIIGIIIIFFMVTPFLYRLPDIFPTNRWVNMMSGETNLNYSEVLRMNISDIEPKLSSIDFGILNTSVETGNLTYSLFSPKNRSYERFCLVVCSDNTINRAWMNYYYIASFPERDIPAEKMYATSTILNVARCCGLNISGDDLIWYVYYQD